MRANIPHNSLVGLETGNYDYVDSYCVALSGIGSSTIDDLVRMSFLEQSRATMALVCLRNAIVKMFGLKTGNVREMLSGGCNQSIEPGKFVGFFKVKKRNEREIVMGEEDKHLDFIVSCLLEQKDNGTYYFYISTLVKFNNMLGNTYFFLIKPFHKVLVGNTLKKIMKRMA